MLKFQICVIVAIIFSARSEKIPENQNQHLSKNTEICSEKLTDPPPIPRKKTKTSLNFVKRNQIFKNSDIRRSYTQKPYYYEDIPIYIPQKPHPFLFGDAIHLKPSKNLVNDQITPLNKEPTASLCQNQQPSSSISQCYDQVSAFKPQIESSECPEVSNFRNTCLNLNCNCQNCQCLTNPSSQRNKRELTSQKCRNQNCNCQNCQCLNCQYLTNPDSQRKKRELTCHNTPSCKDKNNESACRNKRHLEDFGNSVNKFISNLFPNQFKEFHRALVHMNGPTKKATFNSPPQKLSLLEQLENFHKKSNPKFYNKSKFGYAFVNDIPKKPKVVSLAENKNTLSRYVSPISKNVKRIAKSDIPVNPVLKMKYELLKSELEPTLIHNHSKNKPRPISSTTSRLEQTGFFKKPKKQDEEGQCPNLMRKYLKPTKTDPRKTHFYSRNAAASQDDDDEDPMRSKRTIILGSDELDLPAQYEVEMVSQEEPEDQLVGTKNFYTPEEYETKQYSYELPEEEQSFEQLKGYHHYPQDSILQKTPFYSQTPLKKSLLAKAVYKPSLLKPDVIIGKNIIKKAVQEELNNYQKKIEKEQRLKEIRERRNNPFGLGRSGNSQNPMLMLFNAPVDFLRQFHNLNKKSINPVMTTLPNLVYTAKKYFRNFGKDFKNNCMNLASNIIGDFDNVNPSIIKSIVEPQRRYKRELAPESKDANVHETKKTDGILTNPNTVLFKPEYSSVFKNSKEIQKTEGHKIEKRILLEENSELLKPEYSLVFQNSQENFTPQKFNEENIKTLSKSDKKDLLSEQKNLNKEATKNFRKLASSNVRKKRYVIKVVESDEIQSQVEDYLTQKLNFKPLFESRFGENKPVVQPKHTQHDFEEYDNFMESSEEKPRPKKVQIKRVKPRVIIDNKGLAFMEYNGIKRPLLFSKKKTTNLFKPEESASVEKEGKIDMLIQRAKEQSELVGNTQTSIVPQKVIKERITHLLNEIDSLVNSKLDTYDKVCDDLINIHQIKISIEEDWKRLLIDNKIDDIQRKLEILGKFKDIQAGKNLAIKHIAETLQKNNNEFVRKELISFLEKLERLQSLITTVVEDYETRFDMKSPFNVKKDIKFVDYLSEIKFINEKTRNDLVKHIGKKRDEEVQKDIDVLNKLKKLLHFEDDPEKLESIAKIIWEMMNACKMQKDTVKEMNKKLSRNHNVKKELKILLDLQNRFDEANDELQDSLGSLNLGSKFDNEVLKKRDKPVKKDFKEILADIKKRQEEWLKKLKKH